MERLRSLFWSSVCIILVASIVWSIYRLAAGAEDAPQPKVEEEVPKPTSPSTNTIELKSVPPTNQVRIPVYVIPDVVELRIPGVRFVWMESFHLQELAKKFPAVRYTNVIIYNDGL